MRSARGILGVFFCPAAADADRGGSAARGNRAVDETSRGMADKHVVSIGRAFQSTRRVPGAKLSHLPVEAGYRFH